MTCRMRGIRIGRSDYGCKAAVAGEPDVKYGAIADRHSLFPIVHGLAVGIRAVAECGNGVVAF